jgi:hypothetical protein
MQLFEQHTTKTMEEERLDEVGTVLFLVNDGVSVHKDHYVVVCVVE